MTHMSDYSDSGFDLFYPYPSEVAAGEIQQTRDDRVALLYPELDTDGDNIHIEMMAEEGLPLLWLTMRREIPTNVAAKSLRKIADFIERHGDDFLNHESGSPNSSIDDDREEDGPLRLGYDENGDVMLPVYI